MATVVLIIIDFNINTKCSCVIYTHSQDLKRGGRIMAAKLPKLLLSGQEACVDRSNYIQNRLG